MFLVFFAFALLSVSVLQAKDQTYPKKLEWSESKFVLNGKPDEYVDVKLGSDVLSDWVDIPQRHYEFGRYNYGRVIGISIGTWLKPDHHDNTDTQYILEFYLHTQYQIFIENGTLGYAIWDESGNSSTYKCNGNYVLSEWTQLIVFLNDPGHADGSPYAGISLTTKPLDKTTQVMQLNCFESNVNTNLNQNTTQVRLGRGYTGQITPIFIDKYSHPSVYIKMMTCLAHNDAAACRNSILLHPSYSLPDIGYDIETHMSIRREVDSEIRVLFNSDYVCMDGKVGLSINHHHFRIPAPSSKRVRYQTSYTYGWQYRTILDYPANLTVGREGGKACNLTWNQANFTISNVSLLECGFQAEQMDKTTTLYHNSIYLHEDQTRLKLMDIACWYTPIETREEVSIEAYTIQHIQREATNSFTAWKMSVEMFSDGNFTRKLNNPVNLMRLEEEVYVEGRVTAGVTDLELKIESCKTRVSLSQFNTLENVLIKDSTPTSLDVRFLNSTSVSRKRFVFKATRFEDLPNAVVYLSCVMTAKLDSTDKIA